jgi:hypothetical protein
MPAEEAASGFVSLLKEAVPAFRPWLERRLAEKAEQERREAEQAEIARAERMRQAEAEAARLEAIRLEQIKAQEQQQLLLQQQLRQQQQLIEQEKGPSVSAGGGVEEASGEHDGYSLGVVKPHDLPFVDYPSFVASVQGREDSTFVVGRGEIVTVRVPNNETGPRKILWQFCTLSYDIAFGLDYEHMDGNKVQVDAILPIVRFNSHERVIVGAHSVQGRGNWLFNFDNTYSMFRPKTLLLRVASEAARLKDHGL